MELRRPERPFLIGHRGAAALARENSLAAIEAAVQAGVDGVEVDVLRTGTGALVLAHGPEIPPDAPALADGLALVADLGVFVQLDVKLRGAAAEIVAAVRAAGLAERAFVSSFSLPTLAEFRAAGPELPRSYTYPEDRLGLTGRSLLRPLVPPTLALLRALVPRRLPGWLDRVDAAAATLNWTVVTPAAVEVCHRRGAAVYCWTVNDADTAETLVETGVDAIITDDPRSAPVRIEKT
jgi:glycerophosphoryl diester phosphodiesterase